MSKIEWDKAGERFFETGVDRGVLYLPDSTGKYTNGVAWNGLTAVTEAPSGAEANAIYADNIKYLSLLSAEEFGFTIESYYYPDEFGVCDGTAEPIPGMKFGQQPRKNFGLSYRTIMGNDVELNDYGYKIHLIYNATAAPSEKPYATVNDSPEAITFSWECTTTPIPVPGHRPVSLVTIDSLALTPEKLTLLETALYGSAEGEAVPHLPLPSELITLLS